jgi:flagellar assembly protein FliH
MFFSSQAVPSGYPVPVSVFEYPSIDPEVFALPKVEANAMDQEDLVRGITLTDEALAGRLSQARAEATVLAETRVRKEYEGRDLNKVSVAVLAFEREQTDYFARVEAEVVKLALSIAGKILHREAQADPMLVASLVKISLAQLKDGAALTIRTRPEEAERWREHFASGQGMSLNVTVVEDDELEPDACLIETELGSADFSLEAQLKEVEKGFLDVLAHRP